MLLGQSLKDMCSTSGCVSLPPPPPSNYIFPPINVAYGPPRSNLESQPQKWNVCTVPKIYCTGKGYLYDMGQL